MNALNISKIEFTMLYKDILRPNYLDAPETRQETTCVPGDLVKPTWMVTNNLFLELTSHMKNTAFVL